MELIEILKACRQDVQEYVESLDRMIAEETARIQARAVVADPQPDGEPLGVGA